MCGETRGGTHGEGSGTSGAMSHPEIFGFQDVIKIKNKSMFFSHNFKIFPTFLIFTGNLV